MPFPRVIFVEGPTAVGKGFFIDQLKDLLETERPDLDVKVCAAKDWALKGDASSEDRKYSMYNTEDRKVSDIVGGHVELIRHLATETTKNRNQVWIVDRSFLSAITYNLYQDHQYSLRREFTDTFLTAFHGLLVRRSETLMVLLTVGKDHFDTVQVLEDRIRGRQDRKPVDRVWLRALVRNYVYFCPEDYVPCDHIERLTSDDGQLVFEKYFAVEP